MPLIHRLALLATLFVPSALWADDELLASELLADTPVAASATSAETASGNWQQWMEAADTPPSEHAPPITSWGLLPDSTPDTYPPLPLLDLRHDDNHYGAKAPWLVRGEPYQIRQLTLGNRQEGEASWYGPGFHGRRTASGEVFDMHQLTAAHRTLPLPSFVRVTHLGNQQSVIVKVNDRGPFHGNRILDLSYAAARRLGISGTAHVAIEEVDQGKTGHHRKGRSLPRDTAYSLLLGNFRDSRQAENLQHRLISKLPPGIPVSITNVPGPLRMARVEVGPLLSAMEVNLLVRSLRAVRMGLIEDLPRLRTAR